MSLLNLATLGGIQVNGAGAAQKLAFCCTIICYFTSAFLWRRLAERNYLDPRYLLLCMTMNKSVHKMLIHGTLCPLSGGKNVNWTTTLQPVSSVNVTVLVLHQSEWFSGYETLTQSLIFAPPHQHPVKLFHISPTPPNMWRSGVSTVHPHHTLLSAPDLARGDHARFIEPPC